MIEQNETLVDRLRALKDKSDMTTKILAIVLGVIVAALIFLLFFDLFNGGIGYFRY